MSEPTEPMVVDAEPLFKRGDLAVWHLANIPVGITRFLASRDIDSAISSAIKYSPLIHTEACKRNPDRVFAIAAVPWSSLQPRRPIPRGRMSMSEQQWGQQRDDDGVCLVCKADDSMWCDTVVHDQRQRGGTDVAERLASAYGATLLQPDVGGVPFLARSGVPSPRDRRPSSVIRREMAGIPHDKHEPNAYCRRCALALELSLSEEAECLRGPWIDAPLEPLQPFRAEPIQPDRVSAAYVEAMGASTGEHVIRRNTSDLARAAWAAELRAKVQASEAVDRERERARILVDPYFESWE